MTAWTDFLNKTYKEKKASDPTYTYGKAMKDAAKIYKKKGGDAPVSDDEVSGEPDIVEKETVEVEEEGPFMTGGRRRRRRSSRRSRSRSRSARRTRSRSARACGRRRRG